MESPRPLSVPPIIRLVHPGAFARFLRSTGAPADRLMRRVGLPTECDDPAAFVPLRQAWAYFDAGARREDPALGWHVGRYFGDNRLSAGLLRKLEHAPTLYRALQRIVRLISAEASHLELGIRERPDDIQFFTRYTTIKDWPGYATSQAYQIEVYVDLIRHYTGPDWVPPEIGIEAATVPDVVHEHYPGTRVLPGQAMGYVTVPRTVLHRSAQRPPRRDGGRVLLTDRFDLVDTLEVLLAPHLSAGYPSQQLAASLIGASVRTLARRLAAAGVSYREVVDRLRTRVATERLRDARQPVREVANAAGFRDPANFTRMFRRVAGLSPRQYRATHFGGD